MTAASTPARHAPIALWRVAELVLTTLHALFGGPDDLAAAHTLTAKAHRLTATWLRAAEALMRRLLLIEAAAHAQASPTRPRTDARKRAKRVVEHHPHDPDSWRVSFTCVMERRRLGEHRRPPARAPALHRRFFSAWPLAERYEALIRVFNDPTRYAKRLARRLSAAPHRARALLAHPEQGRRTIGPEFDAVHDAAEQAARRRSDTS